jgi:glycosyltransferase involved in cell wall biosynthesis
MYLRKPTIVTDSMSVRDYVTDGENGLVVDGTPEGYVEALSCTLDPDNAARIAAMTENAHRRAREFSSDRLAMCMYAHMMDLLESNGHACAGCRAQGRHAGVPPSSQG